MSHDERDQDGLEGAEKRGPLDVEAAFADIVAHWDDASRTPVGSWPAQEDIGPTIIGDDLTDERRPTGRRRRPTAAPAVVVVRRPARAARLDPARGASRRGAGGLRAAGAASAAPR